MFVYEANKNVRENMIIQHNINLKYFLNEKNQKILETSGKKDFFRKLNYRLKNCFLLR